mgnify:CR=1 FL=1
MAKLDPISLEYTDNKKGGYTCVFLWQNEDRKTVYNVSADMIDHYETSGAKVEEFFYSIN